jgi:hypothetical protein
MISHKVELVIPANAGIQWSAALDTGFRRCDGKIGVKYPPWLVWLKFMANQE